MMDMAIDITMVCPFCGKEHFVTVDFDDCLAWNNGELAQKAFPYLSATEREQLPLRRRQLRGPGGGGLSEWQSCIRDP